MAGLWVVLGFDSNRVPYFPHWIWPVMFTAIAAGLVHMVYRPDRRKLRWIVALSCTVGFLRGLVLSIGQRHPGPAACWLLISMLSVAYYVIRAPQVPERYEEDQVRVNR